MFRPFDELIASLAGLALAIVGIYGIVQIGIIERIAGEGMANETIYPFLGNIIQWVAVIAIVVIVYVGIKLIVNYIRNRKRNRNEEVATLSTLSTQIQNMHTDLLTVLKGLREDLQQNDKTTKDD